MLTEPPQYVRYCARCKGRDTLDMLPSRGERVRNTKNFNPR